MKILPTYRPPPACALVAALMLGLILAVAFALGATPVQVGVGQILLLTENGYTLVRP